MGPTDFRAAQPRRRPADALPGGGRPPGRRQPSARAARPLRYLAPAGGYPGGRRGRRGSAAELPVLTMVTGPSRYLSALLLPSAEAGDLFAGCWQLLAALGAVPRVHRLEQPASGGPAAAQRDDRADQRVRRASPRPWAPSSSSAARPASRRGTSSNARTSISSDRSSQAGPSVARRLQRAARRVARGDREPGTAPAPGRSAGELVAADKRAMLPASRGTAGDRLASADDDRTASVRQLRLQPVLGGPARHQTSAEIIADLSHVTVRCARPRCRQPSP